MKTPPFWPSNLLKLGSSGWSEAPGGIPWSARGLVSGDSGREREAGAQPQNASFPGSSSAAPQLWFSSSQPWSCGGSLLFAFNPFPSGGPWLEQWEIFLPWV